MKLNPTLLLVSAITWVQLAAPTARGQDTNTVEIIKQLQQRIEELEQKVKTLEAGKASGVTTNEDKANRRIEELDQKVKILERNRELQEEAAEAKAKEAPVLALGSQGFTFQSANGDFAVRLAGLLQMDSRTFLDERQPANEGINTLLLRRARPIVQGTVWRDFDFMFVPDFGVVTGPQFATPTPVIQDAFVNYRYIPELQLQAGKFKAPVGLELLQLDNYAFFNERGLPTDLVPNRDLGIELHGDLFEGVVSYAAGVFNGAGDARNSNNADFQNDRAFQGRLFLMPFKKSSVQALRGLGVGLGSSYQSMSITNTLGLPATTGGTLPGYTTIGQQQFFAYNPAPPAGSTTNPVVVASGDHWRLSPQAYYYYGPFALQCEYTISDQKVSRTVVAPFTTRWLAHTGWQVVGGWVLTGEDVSYNGPIVPRHPFNPTKGDWGAFQLAARFSELNVAPGAFPLFSDPNTSARRALEWSVGLNWWLNPNVRLNVSYSQTAFTGGGGPGTTVPATVTQQHEKVVFTRIQLAF